MSSNTAESLVPSITVHPTLRNFVETELLPGLGIDPVTFWSDLQSLIADLTPENRTLLERRDDLQQRIDEYHRAHSGKSLDAGHYRRFLEDLGYLEPGGEPFQVETENVDPEIAGVAGPQLVVPVSNARFALNAANARWGSLYDALYGSDVIPSDHDLAPGDSYNPKRGRRVVSVAADFLDSTIPLESGRHADVTSYRIAESHHGKYLEISLRDDSITRLCDDEQFVGYRAECGRRNLLFRNNGLHIEIRINPDHPVGKTSPAAVCDVILESALTTIQDCEDSVAAVDADDKVTVYRNWLGLMNGTLHAEFIKNGTPVTRRLNADREFCDRNGGTFRLPGRSLMLTRNVGHLMTTPAVFDENGDEVFEGILDAVMTTAAALYDLRSCGEIRNSRSGSIYIVKPKMHGSGEVAFADRLFSRVEDMFALPRHTLKIGVMDEERRTSVNLENCIREVKHRLVFINTGFLDRTGDEIHTSMEAGPMLPKEAIKVQRWIDAYENRNVDVGIRCGLPGRGQIGKGMWPKPDAMLDMLNSKQAHLEAGANCAWVPSPTAATLHAMHYHHVNVSDVQSNLAKRESAALDDILAPPLTERGELSDAVIRKELENNAQGILGYVVRWIDQGIGCSKVPDIDNVGLMEDRATLRIASQLIANWLHHGVCDRQQVTETFQRMAAVVDRQNALDSAYQPMAPNFDGLAFKTALALALEGRAQPNGYTEPLLHQNRLRRKEELLAAQHAAK